MDDYLYKLSQQIPDDSEPFIEKQVLYVLDTNNGSYNGTIQIDTSTLANSGKWAAYSEAYLEVPFVVALQAGTDISAATANINAFMVGLKNGYHQLIDGVQVNYNGSSITQKQSYTNFFVSYKLNTTLSQDSVQKHGDTIGFRRDLSASAVWSSAASANGNGQCNNVCSPVSLSAVNTIAANDWRAGPLDPINGGFVQRQRNHALNLTTGGPNGYGLNPGITTPAQANQLGKSHLTDNNGVAALRVYQWNILATIRLKDLSDFFDKMPLVKGAFLSLTFNTNTTRATVTSTFTAGAPPVVTLINTSITQLSGNTNPMLMASSAFGNPMNVAVASAVANTFTVECGIRSTSLAPTFVNPLLPSCRLVVPCYIMNDKLEEEYIRENRMKKIIYTDIYNYNVLNQASNTTINAILTNGIVNPKSLVVIPVFNNAAGNNAAVALQPFQSMFDSVPGTTSNMAALSSFNVQISGKNAFQQSSQYDYEMFMNELASINALNGGCDETLSSGLLSFSDFQNLYRYYVCDLSRRIPADNKIPLSVVLSAVNGCGKILDLYCFISFQREIVIDVMTGKLQ